MSAEFSPTLTKRGGPVFSTYEEWVADALVKDEASGAAEWKRTDESDIYDYRIIRRRFEELKEIRETSDAERLLYYLKEGIHGNMAGMGAPKLYSHAKFGTKDLITAYVEEIALALEALDKSSQIDTRHKLDLCRRASMGFGRTALMLSGAGSLGAYHLGVCKVLHDQGLLPRVISGASTGAFVAALLGTHTEDDRRQLFADESLTDKISFQMPTEGRREVDLYDLETLLRNLVPDLTFEEAFEVSNLHINIPVAPQKANQRSRLLNAITAPNAMIREAVLASCAIPGRFPAVTLAAKNHKGERQPYIPSRTWVDGSITDEQPAKRLTRHYGINYFVSSNANPLITNLGELGADTPWGPWVQLQQSMMRQWLQTAYPLVMRSVSNSASLSVLARNWFSVATQEYKADLNIMPESRYLRPASFFETLTVEESEALFAEGKRSTWPVVERLRVTTTVSRKLDEILMGHGIDTLIP